MKVARLHKCVKSARANISVLSLTESGLKQADAVKPSLLKHLAYAIRKVQTNKVGEPYSPV
jgi:hypothetical protein